MQQCLYIFESNVSGVACTCRPELWFWDSVVLLLTLALAASQVIATALDTYFQLTIISAFYRWPTAAHAGKHHFNLHM